MISSSFGSANLLGEHFECTSCRKVFKYDSHYQRHILTHSDQRPYACESCGKKFKRHDALKTHEKTHSVNLPFKCSIGDCSQGFASKAALRYHELRHSNNNEFICRLDECNKEFLTLGQLKQHQRTKIHSSTITANTAGVKLVSQETDEAQQHQQFMISSALGLSQTCLPKSEFISGTSISSITTINTIDMKIKGNILKEQTFLDEFTRDEQVFINQIWNQVQQKKIQSMNSNEKMEESQEEEEQYDIQKTTKKIHRESANQETDYSQDILLSEFSRISSLGSTSQFGQLKQELRIIVGVIAKIHNEDNYEDNDIPDEVYDINSKVNSARRSQIIKEEAEDDDEYEGESPRLISNNEFYQNDSKLFFSAESSEKQVSLIRQVIEESGENKLSSKKSSMMKINAAVRLVCYSKKQLLEQRKKKQLEIYESGNYFEKRNNASLKRLNQVNQLEINQPVNQDQLDTQIDNRSNNITTTFTSHQIQEFNYKNQQIQQIQQVQQQQYSLCAAPMIHAHSLYEQQSSFLPINIFDHQQRTVMMMVPQFLQQQHQQQQQHQFLENKQMFLQQQYHPPMQSTSSSQSNSFPYSSHCFSSNPMPFMNIPQLNFLDTILSNDNSDRPYDDSSHVCMPSEADISEENMNIFDADDFANQDRNRLYSEEFLQFMNPNRGAYI